MITKNAEFIDSLNEIMDKVRDLMAMLAALPRDITIRITYEEIGRPDILSSESVTRTIRDVNVGTGGAEKLPPVTQQVKENFTGGFGDIAGQVAATQAEAAAMRDLASQMNDGTISAREFISAEHELVSSQFMAANMAARQANAQRQSVDAITAWWQETNKATPDGAAFATTMAMAAAAISRSNALLMPFNAGMRNTAVSLGAIPIASGLAAFGITSLGTAIHLVVMGVAEFLAVFLPAMYAAAAGAYVMVQGMQLVAQHVNGLYTASEALGPMLNTTAGDMLGLGHSMQTAQDLANPGVFELFGEAIGAINAFSGTATLGLNGLKQSTKGAAGGLTEFSQIGLDVTHMLDAFGAKIVADLQGPLGGTLHSLVASATDDLRTFGQILGNLGHAILSLAAAMPGLAEVVLHVIDGLTALIKWVSQLPAGLLTAVFVIEEMYRWSGLLAGAFGLLGRGIALLGTLGLPVFAAIGRNVASMVANVIAGVANMITNFVAGGTKIGIFGDRVGRAAEGITTKLASAVTFLGGPWGVAIGLGIVAIGALVFWLSRAKDATQQWIDSAQQAVTKASNLSVLNVIALQMAQSTTKLAAANQQYNAANNEMTKGASQAAAKVTEAQDALIKQGQAAGQAAGQTQVYTQKQIDGAQAANEAAGKIQQLTAFQKTLVTQQLNVVGGAAQISKAYGVDFVTALGLADMAGVKLASSMGKNGQLTAQAAIQIGGLVLGYEKMNQTGGILANSMGAVNIQAGIQASKVQALNQSWDQFIQMGTGLTGTFTQLNLDLAQMGNQAPVVGSKIRAFTGGTQMSIGQIATALKSFGGTSAQVWQSYNQSITQANSFTDSLRVASAAGVVSQGQYKQAIASVVGQLIPYAGSSKAALAELEMISQEAGGPAYNASKSLTQNYQDLKSWTDKNAVSSGQFAGMLNDLTTKITNVSKVAANFAGTLQTDVLNAMAQAAGGTVKITQLTNAYTTALSQNGTQSPVTKQAQNDLTAALSQFGFKANDITQIEQILTNTYGKNQAASNTLEGQTTKTRTAFEKYSAQLGINKGKADELWSDIAGRGVNTFNILHNNTDLSKTKFEQLASQLGVTKGHADNLWTALHRLPPTTSVTVKEVGIGNYTVRQTALSGAPGTSAPGSGGPNAISKGAAEGMRVPGFGGGDTFPALLEGGEAVVPKHLVAAIAPFLAAHRVPGFASGGFVDNFRGNDAGLGQFTTNEEGKFVNTMTASMEAAITASTKTAQAAAQAAMNATSFGALGAAPAGAANAVAALRAAGARYGWGSGAEWAALNYVEMREAGYSLTAQNPHSSAYGMAQFINGASEYAQYGGNATTAWGQAVAMTNYIKQRYGDAIAAANHERSLNWYDNGGFLPPGLSLAMNGTGKSERVVAPHQEGGTMEATTPIIVQLDGKQIWTSMQQQTFKYNMRNRGQITGGMSPGK